jgi:hypothetical protein
MGNTQIPVSKDILRRCAYCSRPHPVSNSVAAENPFCNACLPERVAARASQLGTAEIVEDSDYLTAVQLADYNRTDCEILRETMRQFEEQLRQAVASAREGEKTIS